MCAKKSSGWIHSLLVVTVALNVPPTNSINSDEVRLVGGTIPSEGRLEVFYNGTWGTVCNDYFDILNGAVACRQLNYIGVKSFSSENFGPGAGPIWLDDVNCRIDEVSILNCYNRGFGVHNCDHSEDVGIVCDPCSSSVAEEGALRLAGGDCYSNGRVEIFHDGEWGTVCDRGWDIDDATVVCRQLGLPGAISAPLRSYYGSGVGKTWLSGVQCSGSELTLSECDHNGWGGASFTCYHSINDASVECEVENVTTTGTIAPSPTTFSSDMVPPATTVAQVQLPPTKGMSQNLIIPTSSSVLIYPTYASMDTGTPGVSWKLILGSIVIGISLLTFIALLLAIVFVCYCSRHSKSVQVEDLQHVFSSRAEVGLEDHGIDGNSSSEVVYLTNASSIQQMSHA